MSLHFNIYSTVLLVSGVAAAMVGIVLFQRRHPAITWFALLMHASAIWAIAYSFELSSSTLSQMLFWIDVEYIGVSYIPALWIMFVIHFIERVRWLQLTNVILIFLIPTITFAMVITNEYHYLHYASVGLDTSGPFPLLAITTGPWYTIHTVFFYFVMALGMFLLTWHFKRFDALYRKQTVIILAGAMVPWVTNFVYLLGIRPYAHIDLTPYAFILTALIIAFGLTRYKLFDIVPFAREKLIENLREGMIILDEQGRIIDLNATMQKFLGLEESLIGKKLPVILSEHVAIQHLLLKQLQQRIELTITHASVKREYEVSATPLTDKQKNFAGMLLVFWDITARKQTTELLKVQANKLHELNDLKNQLFSIIAHDLKGPIAGINGLLHLAKGGAISEQELRTLIPQISRNMDNAWILMNNLLSWAKSQLEGEQLNPELYDIRDIVERNVALFEKWVSEKGILLQDEILPGTMVYADKDMIDLVVRNVLTNAIKFCDKGDTIKLRAVHHSDATVIMIQDTGTGMDENTQAGLFQLVKVRKTGTRNEKGTGLGLKLCKDFIEKNNGKIWVESKVNSGSTFYIQLPNSKAANVNTVHS